MQQDVKNTIQAKDDELDDCVAKMGDEELDNTLVACVPSGMDLLNLWKRDRRKRSWRRLSAFGIVRDDPSLYCKWKDQREQQQVAEKGEGGEKEDMLGTTCSTDAARRQPWSTDLHYAHRCGVQKKRPPTSEGGMHTTKEILLESKENRSKRTASSSNLCRSRIGTKARIENREKARARPASAPLGSTTGRVAIRPAESRGTTRSPGLARLARVFYQSSVTSIAPMPGTCLHQPCVFEGKELHGERGAEGKYPARAPTVIPESGAKKVDARRESCQVVKSSVHDRLVGAGVIATAVKEEISQETRDTQPELSGAERRMEGVRLLWAVSQLSAEAVTKKIMHGYSERERAREPNRRRMKSARP